MPPVGPHLATDVLELIEISNTNATVGDRDPADFAEGLGVEESQPLGTVAQDEALAVEGQAQTFTAIRERATRRRARAVIHEGDVRLPCQLHELVVPLGQAFPEMCGFKATLLDHFAGFEPDAAERGVPVAARALVEDSISIDEALSDRGRVVRIGQDRPANGRTSISRLMRKGSASDVVLRYELGRPTMPLTALARAL